MRNMGRSPSTDRWLLPFSSVWPLENSHVGMPTYSSVHASAPLGSKRCQLMPPCSFSSGNNVLGAQNKAGSHFRTPTLFALWEKPSVKLMFRALRQISSNTDRKSVVWETAQISGV